MLFYALEQGRLNKTRGRLPLRICVTGARGKSSVTRLLASALREAGFKVLAKTTGSRPMLLLPDGSEIEIRRRGRPSVLEQIKVIDKAADLSADVVVAELMGIRPEILAAESRRIFQPTLLLITNARIDHREYWGPSRETAARCLAAAIPSDCAVFVPDEETMPVWEEAAARMGSELVRVQSPSPPGTAESGSGPGRSPVDGPGGMLAFEPNARLVKAVTDYMTIDRKTADQGIRRSLPDLGELRIWSWRPDPDGPAWDCVSAFAANDPGSTRMVVEELTELGVIDGKPLLGLLNLRRDRGDRTLQWLEAFRQGDLPGLQELFVTGPHARAFTRRCEGQGSALRPVVLETAGPAALMSALKERAAAPAVVLGMGNMGGAGRDLVEYWEREGERRAV